VILVVVDDQLRAFREPHARIGAGQIIQGFNVSIEEAGVEHEAPAAAAWNDASTVPISEDARVLGGGVARRVAGRHAPIPRRRETVWSLIGERAAVHTRV